MIEKAKRQVAAFFRDDEDGATAIEYGLIAALLAISLIGAISSISNGLTAMYENVATGLDTAQD